MINSKSAIYVFLLFLILPGCLARYGEGRLEQLLLSVNDLKRECESNGEELTEEKIKKRLGKPGFLKPVYEHNLNVSFLDNLKDDAGVVLVPDHPELYDDMLTSVKNGKYSNIKLLSYVYDRMGSLEATSLTFYIGSNNSAGRNDREVFGWDYINYGNKDKSNFARREKAFINYQIDTPVDFLRLPYTFLVDTVIGLKQFAGEVIKSPISFLEEEIYENVFIEKKIPFYKFDGIKAAIEDWRNGVTAITYRHRVDGNQGFLAVTQNLLGEIPLVGSVFDQWYEKESGPADKLFLTRGIFGGDVHEQNTSFWVQYFKKRLEDTEYDDMISVEAVPYKYGSTIDVLWALFNISHGYAYEMASQITFNFDVSPGDTVLLSGHSGGVQRILSTARILHDDEINVKKMYGITGPVLGYAPCSETNVVLNSKFFQDPVSEVSKFLKYTTLNLLTLNTKWSYDDRIKQKKEDIYYRHVTPGFIANRTRVKYDGYLRDNFSFFFK